MQFPLLPVISHPSLHRNHQSTSHPGPYASSLFLTRAASLPDDSARPQNSSNANYPRRERRLLHLIFSTHIHTHSSRSLSLRSNLGSFRSFERLTYRGIASAKAVVVVVSQFSATNETRERYILVNKKRTDLLKGISNRRVLKESHSDAADKGIPSVRAFSHSSLGFYRIADARAFGSLVYIEK